MRALVWSTAASVLLVVVYLALGGASYAPAKVADPCAARDWTEPDGLAEVGEQIVLSALDGAACELGVSREEIVLAFESGATLEEFGREHDVSEEDLEQLVRAGLDRAITDAERGRCAQPADRGPDPVGRRQHPARAADRPPGSRAGPALPLRLDSIDVRGRPRRAPHAPGRLGRVGHHVEPRARAGDRPARQGLLGVRPARHRLRPARASTGSTPSTQIYHWTELIQSSPLAVERSVHGAIGGAYRSQGITTLELRFNPMKRNRGGERDLDHIILAAIRGLDRASIEYPQVRCGLILMMDRTFTQEQNGIIVEKAIRWASRGVVGIDIAGPRPGGARYPYRDLAPLVEEARVGRPRRDHPRRRGGRRARAGRGRRGRRDASPRPDRPRHPRRAATRS